MHEGDRSAPLLDVEGLNVHLGHGSQRTRILNDVSFSVAPGTTLGIVGESGSGKSTLAKTIVGIHAPHSGAIRFRGEDIGHRSGRRRRGIMREVQMIPQDPYSSLDPRRTIAQTLAEAIDPARVRVGRHRERVDELLALVQLDRDAAARYPREFSGGQRQRIAIARALAVDPELVIADEITSALDLSTQAEVLKLFADLKKRLGITVLFVSHNLAVVQEVSDSVLVLLHGETVEHRSAEEIFRDPRAPYTRLLLDSVPGGPGFSLDA
ncbi:ABC transporter ATP-binding protein [Leucobacter chromiiresistens]|nr:ABC transporter ATP-binding protein [Leucobacter chromiiresistens]